MPCVGFSGDILIHGSHITATLSLLGNWKQKSQKVSNLQSWQWHGSCCSWNINSEHIAAGFILCGSTRRHLFNKAAAVWILNIHTRLAGSNSRHTYRSIKSRLYKHRLIGPLWSNEPASLNNAPSTYSTLSWLTFCPCRCQGTTIEIKPSLEPDSPSRKESEQVFYQSGLCEFHPMQSTKGLRTQKKPILCKQAI